MKRYVAETRSSEFETFVRQANELVTARLTLVELRCALARRGRAGTLPAHLGTLAYRLFEEDVVRGEIEILAMPDSRFGDALRLIEALDPISLRTLDALHLAAAQAGSADGIATADRVMADTGQALGIEVAYFGAT